MLRQLLKSFMLIMRVFEVVDEKIKKSVKDEARGTEERVSTTNENNAHRNR